MRLAIRATVVAACLIQPVAVMAEPPRVAESPPRSPADERKAFHLPPGFEAQLVAAEPDLQKPINMAFDAKGRLWVTCTVEYPFPAPEGKGRDTVKVLSDFGPDGKARKVETFADGLNIPIGVLPYQDGAIVYSIPNLWRLRDTDGDGKCDKREVLYSGFGHKDTHGMVNGLVMGFDGWVYACHGFSNDSAVKGTDGSEVRMNSGNVFRFKPDGSRVELFAKGQVNPFGSCFDPLGNLYTACCHSKPITQVLRGAVYHSFFKPHDGLGWGPDMVHKYRGSTALCGLSFYDADNFPQQYHGGMFLGDVVNNSINFFAIERKGGTYTAKQQADFLTSDDPWFRPADIKLGPDGALYVADFYNRIIGHYEVPLTHPGRDRTSGRIWRIVYKGTANAPRTDWTKAPIKDLIDDLNHATLTVRMTATRQLVERGAEAVEPVRAVLASDAPTPRAHALWVLERLGALTTGEVESALTSTDLVVKVHALRILAERPKLTDDQALYVGQMLVGPADGVARRVAADVLARHPGAVAQRAVLNALTVGAPAGDPFFRHALRIALREQFRGQAKWDGIREQDRGVVADITLGLPEPAAADFLVANVWWLAEHQAGRMPSFAHHVARYAEPDRAGHFVASVRQSGRVNATGAAQPVLLALLRGFQERGGTPPADVVGWGLEHCNTLLHAPKPDDLQAGIELAAALKRPELQVNVVRILINRQVPEAVRVAALNGLAAYDMSRFVGTVALRLADMTESITFREKVAAALAAVNAAEARTALLTTLSTAPARLASAIASGLAGTPDGAAALLDAVAAGKASPRLLQERPVQLKLAVLKRNNLSDRVAKLTESLPPADEKLAVLLRTRADAFAKAHPGADAGAKVYEKHCAACHQIAGKGAKVGPQLDGIAARGLDRLLEDVLDPNRNVDQTFRATTLTLKTGQSLTGLVLREEGEVIVLADAQGKEQRVSRGQLAEREVSPLSAMPANWSDQIPEKEFHDLMAYLLAQRAK